MLIDINEGEMHKLFAVLKDHLDAIPNEPGYAETMRETGELLGRLQEMRSAFAAEENLERIRINLLRGASLPHRP